LIKSSGPWTTPSSTGPKSPHDSQCPLLLKPCHLPFRVPSRQMQQNLNVPNTSFRFSRLGLSFFALGLTILSIWNTTDIQSGDWVGSSPYRGRGFSAQAARPHWHDTGKSLGTRACEVAKGLDALTTPLLLSSVPLNATFNQWQFVQGLPLYTAVRTQQCAQLPNKTFLPCARR
jgi:hypothetical protein